MRKLLFALLAVCVLASVPFAMAESNSGSGSDSTDGTDSSNSGSRDRFMIGTMTQAKLSDAKLLALKAKLGRRTASELKDLVRETDKEKLFEKLRERAERMHDEFENEFEGLDDSRKGKARNTYLHLLIASHSKRFRQFVENHPVAAEACKAELDAIEAMVAENAETIAIDDLSTAAATETVSMTVPQLRPKIAAFNDARKAFVKCVLEKRLDRANENALAFLEKRLTFHSTTFSEWIGKIDAKLAELEQKGADADRLMKARQLVANLKEKNQKFLVAGNALKTECSNSETAGKDARCVYRIHKFAEHSRRFQNLVAKTARTLVKAVNVLVAREPKPVESASVDTEVTASISDVSAIEEPETTPVLDTPLPLEVETQIETSFESDAVTGGAS